MRGKEWGRTEGRGERGLRPSSLTPSLNRVLLTVYAKQVLVFLLLLVWFLFFILGYMCSLCVFHNSDILWSFYWGAGQRSSGESPEPLTQTFAFSHSPTGRVSADYPEFSACLKASLLYVQFSFPHHHRSVQAGVVLQLCLTPPLLLCVNWWRKRRNLQRRKRMRYSASCREMMWVLPASSSVLKKRFTNVQICLKTILNF